MSHFPDLTPYTYTSEASARCLNVGWLDSLASFSTGDTSEEFKAKLFEFCLFPENVMRGFHVCNLCVPPKSGVLQVSRNLKEAVLGNAEVRVRGADGVVYAAPTLIYHYVSEHHYLPPQQFIQAIIECSPEWQKRSKWSIMNLFNRSKNA